jgi:hypothetical protein
MTTQADIREWLNNPRWQPLGKTNQPTHMIVAVDTFDYGDYPKWVYPNENVRTAIEAVNRSPMQRVMEVYSYSLDLEDQLKERRAYHV